MKRAVLYLRVSTLDQTTANQERELREIAGHWAARSSRSTKIMALVVPRLAMSGLLLKRSAAMPQSVSSTL